MTLYAAIDLHSKNNYLCVIDGEDKRFLEVRLDSDASLAIQALKPFKWRLMPVPLCPLSIGTGWQVGS